MKTFTINGIKYKAENCIENILINPVLPKNFDDTPNDERSKSHHKFNYMPYVLSDGVEENDKHYKKYGGESEKQWKEEWRKNFLEKWPNGRYEVRCLDGGAWDRSTWCGQFDTLEKAIDCAKARKDKYK